MDYTATNVVATVTIIATISSLLTEFIKKLTNDKFSANLVDFITSIVSTFVYVGYLVIYQGYTADTKFVVYWIFIGIISWIGSMIGYDKVKQTLAQLVVK